MLSFIFSADVNMRHTYPDMRVHDSRRHPELYASRMWSSQEEGRFAGRGRSLKRPETDEFQLSRRLHLAICNPK